MTLKPQNLLQAAEADLRRRVRNIRTEELRYAAKQSGHPCNEQMDQYAFYAPHVRKAKSARELLILALMHPPYKLDRELGRAVLRTTKANTRLIYSNGALLVQAIRKTNPKYRVPMWKEEVHVETESA